MRSTTAVPDAFVEMAGESARDLRALSLQRVGEVRATGDPVLPYVVLDVDGTAIEPISEFLRELVACDDSEASVRSYAYDLLRWFRFVATVGIDWAQAGRTEVRDFVAWLRVADNPQRRTGTRSIQPGSVNPRTGKRHLPPGYAPATINHALSVLAAFYGFHAEAGTGPAVTPVPATGRPGFRVDAHHNQMEPFAARRRAAYRQKQEMRFPRAIPDDLYAEVFAAMTCHRDRALVAFYVSSCARPSELLGLTGADVDYGEQRVAVVTKGSRVREWVPASPESFVWLALYLADGFQVGLDQPLWWTRRQPRRPLTYTAMRAVLGRVNARLGTNLSLHDFRHTGALRLARDPEVAITDVQAVLRHRWLASTGVYTRARIEDVISRVHEHYRRPPPPPLSTPTWQYASADLAELFGNGI